MGEVSPGALFDEVNLVETQAVKRLFGKGGNGLVVQQFFVVQDVKRQARSGQVGEGSFEAARDAGLRLAGLDFAAWAAPRIIGHRFGRDEDNVANLGGGGGHRREE